MSRIRVSARRPRRSVRVATGTLSTESRLTTQRFGTGSSSGSSCTSLGSDRIVVVQGAIRLRRRRGMAASRESTATGRRPAPGSSHHQISPRAGSSLTSYWTPAGTRQGCPSRPAGPVVADRMRRMKRRSRRRDVGPAVRPKPGRPSRRRWSRRGCAGRRPTDVHRRSCLCVCEPYHDHGMTMAPGQPGSYEIVSVPRRCGGCLR